MQFIRGLHNLLRQKKECVATIGNFDGVHLGHRAVLDQVKESAHRMGLVSTVVIFEPQPIEYFEPNKSVSRITRLREKLQQFEMSGIDRVICLRFDAQMANLSGMQFIDDILLHALAVKKLIVGDDFRFGKDRKGDYPYLLKIAQDKGFAVQKTDSFVLHTKRVSSTLIRQALTTGDMVQAKQLLGRPYHISGRVVHGEKRGRELGFATANINLHRYFSPLQGIFSARVYGINEPGLDAVAYIGSKPMFDGKQMMLEVHLLDFNGDLYGRYLQVELLEKLRSDIHFSSKPQLIKQIQLDIQHARKSLKLK